MPDPDGENDVLRVLEESRPSASAGEDEGEDVVGGPLALPTEGLAELEGDMDIKWVALNAFEKFDPTFVNLTFPLSPTMTLPSP